MRRRRKRRCTSAWRSVAAASRVNGRRRSWRNRSCMEEMYGEFCICVVFCVGPTNARRHVTGGAPSAVVVRNKFTPRRGDFSSRSLCRLSKRPAPRKCSADFNFICTPHQQLPSQPAGHSSDFAQPVICAGVGASATIFVVLSYIFLKCSKTSGLLLQVTVAFPPTT